MTQSRQAGTGRDPDDEPEATPRGRRTARGTVLTQPPPPQPSPVRDPDADEEVPLAPAAETTAGEDAGARHRELLASIDDVIEGGSA